jgi:hypothetical protein
MSRNVIAIRMAGLLLVGTLTWGLLTGCPQQESSSDGGVSLQQLQSDYDASQSASASLDQLLDTSSDATTAVAAFVQSMQDASGVVAAAVDSDDSATAWVMYRSGLEHVHQVIDEDEELDALDAPATTKVIASGRDATFDERDPGPTAQPIAGFEPTWAMPASTTALVANSLTICQPLQDTRDDVKLMLESVGYMVERKDATIDLFMNDKITKYGVIFVEAHGGRRTKDEAYFDRVNAHFANVVLEQNLPYCGTVGNAQHITTTDLATREAMQTWKQDLECGRLRIRTTYLRRGKQKIPCATTFAVTPDFIRHYNKNNFPDYTVMCLSACRTFDKQGNSEWANLLSDRGDGGNLLGWDYRVHYGVSAKAFLNLFQLLTGSDREKSLTSQRTGKTHVLLEKNKPPVGVQELNEAFNALISKQFDRDNKTGARLVLMPDLLSTDFKLSVLAPGIGIFRLDQTGESATVGYAGNNATLRIVHEQTQAGVVDIDMGTYGSCALIGQLLSGLGCWKCQVPVGAAGSISVLWDGRKSPPRDLMRWKPSFKVTGTGPNGLTYTITYLMQARALPATRWESAKRGPFVWDRPDDGFSAAFDSNGSVVSWSVSGGKTVGTKKYTHSGGGSQNMVFAASDMSSFASTDGQTADMSFSATLSLTYTETVQDLLTSQVTTSTKSLPTTSVRVDGNPLLSDWTIQGGSQTLTLSSGWTGQLTWQNCTPTPPYNSDTMLR